MLIKLVSSSCISYGQGLCRSTVSTRQLGSLVVKAAASGGIRSLEFQNQKTEVKNPLNDQVVITMQTSALTSEDVRAVRGISLVNSLNDGGVGGLTGVGSVQAVGNNVTSLKVSDKVLVVDNGTWTDHVTVSSKNVVKLSSEISSETLATYPALLSAWSILHEISPLKPNDCIVQLDGSSAIGQAINEIGKILKLQIVNIPLNGVNSSNFKEQVSKLGGAKLVISSHAGKPFRDAQAYLIKNGIAVFYNGKSIPVMSGDHLTISTSDSIFSNKAIQGFDFTTWFNSSPKSVREGIIFLEANKSISIKPQILKQADHANAIKTVESTDGVVVFKY